MLFYLATRIISSAGAFLYPGYASYKVLSQRPAPEHELERWLMYWSVLGCLVGVEYVAEWLISWIPFYYTIKTLFLLYLALPQTQGASYLYLAHLHPFLHAHETQIDSTLAQVKARAYAFIQERARALWEAVAGTMMGQAQVGDAQFAPVTGPGQVAPPPSLGDPASGPAALLSGWLRSYGPGMMATGAALLKQVSAPAVQAQQQRASRGLTTPASSRFNRSGTATPQSVSERRRQLEAELAALQRDEAEASGHGFSVASTRAASRMSSYAGMTSSAVGSPSQRYEELEAPSDAEGYEVDDDQDKQATVGRAGWFGWGGAAAKGYERVKSD